MAGGALAAPSCSMAGAPPAPSGGAAVGAPIPSMDEPMLASASMRKLAELTTTAPSSRPASTSMSLPDTSPVVTSRGISVPRSSRTNTSDLAPVKCTAERGITSALRVSPAAAFGLFAYPFAMGLVLAHLNERIGFRNESHQRAAGTVWLRGGCRSWYVDERSDPEKATIAAAQYLKTLWKMFDDVEQAAPDRPLAIQPVGGLLEHPRLQREPVRAALDGAADILVRAREGGSDHAGLTRWWRPWHHLIGKAQ